MIKVVLIQMKLCYFIIAVKSVLEEFVVVESAIRRVEFEYYKVDNMFLTLTSFSIKNAKRDFNAS